VNDNLNKKLNEFLDGNLDDKELENLNEIILNDADAFQKLKGLKTVDNILQTLEAESVPDSFTKNVMDEIRSKKAKKQKSNNYFYQGIVFVFVACILFFTGYAVYFGNGKSSPIFSTSLFKNISENLGQYLSVLNIVVFSYTSLIIAGTLSLILLVTFYFIVSEHTAFMKRINQSVQ